MRFLSKIEISLGWDEGDVVGCWDQTVLEHRASAVTVLRAVGDPAEQIDFGTGCPCALWAALSLSPF
jgi:hypothetical protein